ncbi:hypothetical protein VTK73DRAFT_7859 [Phialemonium thermophilum]|uniref:Uncharacterized protein n=1 Tax=Phialemonium thermophilum TaxID=223376 RepID=A0ABR3WCA7_9PEZI
MSCDGNRKRFREEEYQDVAKGGSLGFTEHRSKRIQALPLRMTPTWRRRSSPLTFPTPMSDGNSGQGPARTITPSDSDPEELHEAVHQQDALHYRPSSQTEAWSDTATSALQGPSAFHMEPELPDTDMDMVMDAPEPAAQHGLTEDGLLRPGPSQPDASNITGRIPTPIHCSFAAQVKGNNWGGAAGNVMRSTQTPQAQLHGSLRGEASSEETYRNAVLLGSDAVPRSFDGSSATASVMADWSMVQNRRLPSPISESGGEDSADGGVNSPACMAMDSPGGRMNCHGHQHPLLSTLPPRSSSAMAMGSEPRTDVPPRVATPTIVPNSSPGGPDSSAMEVDGAVTPSPRKGHTRSRHTLNSWTVQPGMKKSFSIGYRADCEKCRLKIPGHFNHIVIS